MVLYPALSISAYLARIDKYFNIDKQYQHYFKYSQTLNLCATMFYKTTFYYNVFRRHLKSGNIKMVKGSYILHWKCVFFPKFDKLAKFFPVVCLVTILKGVICQNMEQFISWAIIERLTESESILPKRGIKVHFRACLQP